MRPSMLAPTRAAPTIVANGMARRRRPSGGFQGHIVVRRFEQLAAFQYPAALKWPRIAHQRGTDSTNNCRDEGMRTESSRRNCDCLAPVGTCRLFDRTRNPRIARDLLSSGP